MPSYPPAAQTTNSTPQAFSGFGPVIEEDAVCRGTVFVFAFDHGIGAAYWEFRMLLRRLTGSLQNGIFTQIVHSNSPSASTWNVVCAISGGGAVEVTVTGENGKTIDWLAITDDVICMSGPFV